MQLYRFSPIQSRERLFEAVQHIHVECFQLCKQSFGFYLPVAGNVGVFCHYDSEYDYLTDLRKDLCEPSDNPKQKYFKLHEPIVISAISDLPQAIYTHLYIRKPDPYRGQVGDIDFIIDEQKYQELKTSLMNGAKMPGARIFDRPDLDMIELHDPDSDALGYVSPQEMTQKVRIQLT
jgi:hypothetical protein